MYRPQDALPDIVANNEKDFDHEDGIAECSIRTTIRQLSREKRISTKRVSIADQLIKSYQERRRGTSNATELKEQSIQSVEVPIHRMLSVRHHEVQVDEKPREFKHALEVPRHSRNHLITSYSLPRGLISSRKVPRLDLIEPNQLLSAVTKDGNTGQVTVRTETLNEPPRPKGFQGYMLLNSVKFKKFILDKDRIKRQSLNIKASTPVPKEVPERPFEQPSLSKICSEVDLRVNQAYQSERYQYKRCYLELLDFRTRKDQRFKHNMTPKPL